LAAKYNFINLLDTNVMLRADVFEQMCAEPHHAFCTCWLAVVRPHRSTTYVNAAYCYRLSSVVYRCVCHSSEPCKTGWPDRDEDAVWVEDSGGPNYCYYYYYNHFMALFPGPPGWAGARRETSGLYGSRED